MRRSIRHIRASLVIKAGCFALILFSFFILHSSFLTNVYAEAPERIVSLAPSMTELLYAVGLEDRIVGVTNYCDYPEEAQKKQKIGGMSNPSLEAVVSLKPDLVVMTTNGNPEAFEERLRSMNIRTYVFRARDTDQLSAGIRKMGIDLDEKEKFDELAGRIEEELKSFRAKKIGSGKKVLFLIWPEPLMVAGPGTAIHDAITLLGATNIAGDTTIQYPKYSIEEIIRRSPDIIFIGKATGMESMEEVSVNFLKRISYVPAVKNNKVFYVSDSLYRLGPRVIAGIEEMAEYLTK